MEFGLATTDVIEPPDPYLEVLVDELSAGDAWRCQRCGSLVVDREAHDGFHDRTEW